MSRREAPPPQTTPGRRFVQWLAAEDGGEQTSRPSSPRDVMELVKSAVAFADESYVKVGGPRLADELACARGCSHCCHLPVETTVAEVARGWDHARRTCSPDQLGGIRRRAEAAASAYPEYAARPDGERLDLPCPFLSDGACAIYPVRPLTCRGWNSYRVDACRAAREEGRRHVQVPSNPRIRAVFANAGEALARGLRRAGLEPLVYLAPAVSVLAAAESTKACLLGWLSGADPFASARIGPPGRGGPRVERG